MANKLKDKVIISSDFHHGSHYFVNYISQLAKANGITEKSKDKISVVSTGDFAVYNANNTAPKEIVSEYFTLLAKRKEGNITKKFHPRVSPKSTCIRFRG